MIKLKIKTMILLLGDRQNRSQSQDLDVIDFKSTEIHAEKNGMENMTHDK